MFDLTPYNEKLAKACPSQASGIGMQYFTQIQFCAKDIEKYPDCVIPHLNFLIDSFCKGVKKYTVIKSPEFNWQDNFLNLKAEILKNE